MNSIIYFVATLTFAAAQYPPTRSSIFNLHQRTYGCPKPAKFPYTTLSPLHTTYPIGSTIYYRCNHGYIIGRNWRQCSSFRTWTGIVPNTCGCFRPNDPSNGYIQSFPSQKERFQAGQYVDYRCDHSYSLIGNGRSYCQKTGVWTSTPTCIRSSHATTRPYSSTSRPYYSTSRPYYSTSRPYYSTLTPYYSTSRIYATHRPYPPSTRYSTTSYPSTCTHRNPPTNGYYANSKDKKTWRPGDVATYACRENYCMYGNADSRCQDDGRWQYGMPSCRGCCSRPSPPQYGSIRSTPQNKAQFYYGDSVYYQCNPGYTLQGNSRVKCSSNGWANPPTCQIVKSCPSRPAPENGHYAQNAGKTSWRPGDVATYGCKANYCLYGQATSDCQDDETWNHGVPTCRVCCQRPTPPPHGSIHSVPVDRKTFYIDDWIIYRCDHGYKLDGDSKVGCLKGGWTHSPTCKRIKCSHRNAPNNGYYSGSGNKRVWYPEETANYGCQQHYCMYGNSSSTCQYDGTWDNDLPNCRGCCKRPSPPQYGSITSNPPNKQTFYINDWVTYGCQHGYELVGDARVDCLQGGWGHAPTCRRIRCSHRNAPEYGSYADTPDKKDWYPGDTATYDCNQNYCMNGDASATCQYDGSWQNDVPKCRGCCQRPLPPQYGSITSNPANKQTFYIDESITYACELGYKLDGDARVNCVKGGWSHAPTCQRIFCLHRNAPENGNYAEFADKTIWYAGETAVYICNQYYCMSGDPTSTCQYDGTWQNDVPRCRGCCQRPQPPQFGSITSIPPNKQTFYVGDTIDYGCDAGYRLIGGHQAECEIGGWNNAPTCQRIFCPYRNPPEYGYYTVNNVRRTYNTDNKWYPGDTTNFACQEGYCLSGPVNSDCQNDGTWQNNLPVCRPCCHLPSPPANGAIRSPIPNRQKFYVNDYIEYSCDDGYRLYGNARVVCESNGWASEPTCRRIICSHRNAPEYGHYRNNQQDKTTWYPGDQASYGCKTHYCMQGDPNSNCKKDGTWQNDVPTCRPCCGRPQDPDCGYVISQPRNKPSFYLDDTVTYQCRDGCYLQGYRSPTCVQGGWSHHPTCRRGCAYRHPPQYGRYVNKRDNHYSLPGDVVAFACKPNYFLYGSYNSTCLSNSTWDTDVPTCRPGCHRPSNPHNGYIITNPRHKRRFSINDWVQYQCNSGYQLYGDRRSYCRASGWFNTPHCKRICTHRTPSHYVSYKRPTKTNWYVNDVAEYSCPKDYIMAGHPRATCQADGSWDNNMPRCRRPCPHRYPPRDGKYRAGSPHDFYSGDVAHFECVQGYRMSGYAESPCQDDGTWRYDVPNCQVFATCQNKCGNPNVGGCACDYQCQRNGDCCSDYQQYCSRTTTYSPRTYPTRYPG